MPLLLLVAFAVIIFLFSQFTVWMHDDVAYRYIVFDNNESLQAYGYDGIHYPSVSTLGELVYSQTNFWHLVNGRFVAHTLVQLFCGILGQTAFALANAAAWILLLWLLAKISGVSLRNSRVVLTLILLTTLPLAVKMMPSTQISFIWMGALNLLFFIKFFKTSKRTLLQTAGVGLLAFLAGNGQEAYSMCVLFAGAVYIIARFKSMNPSKWVMAICYFLGFLALYASPATRDRINYTSISLIMSACQMLGRFKAPYILFFVIIYYKYFKKSLTFKQIWASNRFLWMMFLGGIIGNLYIGVENYRQLFGIELAAIIITLRILPGGILAKGARWALAIATLIFWGWNVYLTANFNRQYRDVSDKYAASPDGIVYYDFAFYNCLPALMYGVCPWGIPENDHMNESIQMLFKDKYSRPEKLIILPTCLERKLDEHWPNTVIKSHSSPNKYILITDKTNPAQFRLHRSLLGVVDLGWATPSFNLPEPLYEGETYIVRSIVDLWPGLIYDSVETVSPN